MKKYNSLQEFYPFYLSQHQNPTCQKLHLIGNVWAILSIVLALVTGRSLFFLSAVIGGYGFAWIGHFFFEHNKPATFQYPILSFFSDLLFLRDFLRCSVRTFLRNSE